MHLHLSSIYIIFQVIFMFYVIFRCLKEMSIQYYCYELLALFITINVIYVFTFTIIKFDFKINSSKFFSRDT